MHYTKEYIRFYLLKLNYLTEWYLYQKQEGNSSSPNNIKEKRKLQHYKMNIYKYEIHIMKLKLQW